MKRIVFILLLGAFAYQAGAQIFKPREEEIPKEYWQDLNKEERKEVRSIVREDRQAEKATKDQVDFFIPEVPLPVPDSWTAAGDTWYREYLECSAYEDTLDYKGTFVMAIMGTGEPDHKGVVKYKYPGHTSKSYTGEPVIDGHSHETHVAGSQVYADETDVFGVAKAAAEAGKFYQVYYKVCTNYGGCSFTWIAQAIRDHIAFFEAELKPKGIHSGITMSLGGPTPSSDVENAMKEAVAAGLLVFASAGNNGRQNLSFPAESQYAQAVGAHDSNGNKASFSNWGKAGEEIYSTAPGVSILSTCKGDSKCIMSGTSMSCPMLAALAGVVWIIRPDFSAEEVLNHLSKNSADLGEEGYDNIYGYGTPKYSAIIQGLKKDQPDDPGDPPPPPAPEPPRKKRSVVFTIEDGYFGNWRPMDDEDFTKLTFYDLEISVTGTTPTEELYAEATGFVHDFFADGRRSVIVPADWDYDTGVYWFGRFLEILAKREGIPLQVVSIAGEQESGANAKFSGNKSSIKEFLQNVDPGCTVELQGDGATVILPCSMSGL